MKRILLLRLSVALLWFTTSVGFTSPIWASGEATAYNRIHLSTSADTQLENDTLAAILYIQREGAKLPNLADEVNRGVAEAIRQSRKVAGVDLQTLDYQSSPIYDKQRLSGWRVRQSIRLQSRDSARLSQLIEDLQSILAVQSINYRVSPAKMREAEKTLTAEAIDAFTQRAKLITRQFGYTQYRLVEITVHTAEEPVQPLQMRGRVMAMGVQAEMAPPAIMAGKQEIQVTVSGTIEMYTDEIHTE